MQNNEKTLKELLSLIMSQYLETYNEMRSVEAYAAIEAEWDDQMAAVFEALLFRASYTASKGKIKFVEINRDDGNGSYMVPERSDKRRPE